MGLKTCGTSKYSGRMYFSFSDLFIHISNNIYKRTYRILIKNKKSPVCDLESNIQGKMYIVFSDFKQNQCLTTTVGKE